MPIVELILARVADVSHIGDSMSVSILCARGLIRQRYLTNSIHFGASSLRSEVICEWQVNRKFPTSLWGIDVHHRATQIRNRKFVLSQIYP